uniref:Uncharacterized protein n=1 Tax=Octopus bimaculoides TaxID=37653 RepID=A0A0L8HDK5_OCTBM
MKNKVLELLGHTMRMVYDFSKICLEGMIKGKRNRGPQLKRWRKNSTAWT